MQKSLETILKEIKILEELKELGFKYRQIDEIKDIDSIYSNDVLQEYVHDYIDIKEINGLIRTKLEEANSELKSLDGPIIINETVKVSLRNTKMEHYSGYCGVQGYTFIDTDNKGE